MDEQEKINEFTPMAELIARSAVKKYCPAYEYDDLLQAAFIGLLQACRSYNPDKSKFSTHAYNSMNYAVRQQIRTNTGVVHVPYKGKQHENPLQRIVLTDSQWDTFTMEDTDIESVEQRIMIKEAMHDLTPTQQEVIDMYYFQDMTYEEIAEARGVSRQAVGQAVLEALKVLRNRLSADDMGYNS